MKFLQTLLIAGVSGVVSGLLVMIGVVVAFSSGTDSPEVQVETFSSGESLEPSRCDIPEECHLFKRGVPYQVKDIKIKDGEMLVLIKSMDANIEPQFVLSRQTILRKMKPGTIFILLGTGDLSSSLVELSSGQDKKTKL